MIQTNADQSKRLEVQPDIAFGSAAPLPFSIAVDGGIRYQQMDGYGARFTDSSAWLVWNKLTPDQRATVMRDLFGPSGIKASRRAPPCSRGLSFTLVHALSQPGSSEHGVRRPRVRFRAVSRWYIKNY